jgi:tetratricopeptide (TPR) repeat protein
MVTLDRTSRTVMRLWTAAVLLASAAAIGRAADGPRSEEALRESVLRLASGDVAGAEAEARAAVAADPGSARALQQLSRSANAALDFAVAEDAAGRALALSEPAPVLYCLRSEARSGRGDYAGALADAQAAARLNPGSGTAALRSAVAKEGLRRSPEETLADYRRAAELDASLASLRDAAVARLTPQSSRTRPGLGVLIALLSFAGAAGWTWARMRRGAEPAPRLSPGPPALRGEGRLTPGEAARALAAASRSARDPEAALALARSLYERLTGRPPAPAPGSDEGIAPPSTLARGLPVGIDAFFERALNPDPERRFRSGPELSGAFRSLVDPSVD